MNQSTNDRLLTHLATLGPVGHLPKMPGTWGSLVAALLAPYLFLSLPLIARPAMLLIVLAVGVFACTRAEIVMGQKDPSCVVIDELFGMWVTILPLSANAPWWFIGAAFVLFRFFDILKPWPIKLIESKYPAGFGVMLDDGAAGLYALACVMLLVNLLSAFGTG